MKIAMKSIFVIIGFSFISIIVSPKSELNSSLKNLDNAIIKRNDYTFQRRNYLEKIKGELLRTNLNNEDLYTIYRNLAKEYESFVCDSAIFYSKKSFATAEKIGKEDWINDSKIQLARSEAKAGIFTEVINILNPMKENQLNKHQLVDYYNTYIDAYTYWIEYQDGQEVNGLITRKKIYQNKLFRIISPNTYEYAIRYGFYCIEVRDYKNALKILLSYIPKVKPYTPEYANMTSVLSFLYEKLGNKEKQKEYLILSAISDTESSIKENISLRELALLLFDEGDIDRAEKYIKISLNDANFYNARLRNIQTSKLLPIIDNAYQTDREIQQRKLQILLIAVSILLLILAGSVVFIVIQMRKLSEAKKYTDEINKRLNELNIVLQDSNKTQTQINISLTESNRIKEKFISSFLDICTEYIEKLNIFKTTVNRKIKAGQIPDLLKITSATDSSEEELKELFSNFDRAFLNIYPTFVSEFNILLKKEEQYKIHGSKSLNHELRIFALIKLGIKDTNKIATFLHYTPRTVYNYRSKVKSKAIDTSKDFEKAIRHLCSDIS